MATANHIATFVREAGELLRELASDELCSIAKSDGTPATQADLKSQEILVKGFHEGFRGWPILVEEYSEAEVLHRKIPGLPLIVVEDDKTTTLPERYVSIDPADGTAFLVNKYPAYAVSVAMVECGLPVVSVLYMPALELMIVAEKGSGCEVNGAQTTLTHNKRLNESLIGLDNCRTVDCNFRSQVIDPILQACLFPTNLPSVASGIDLLLGRTGAWVSSNARNWDIAGTCLAVEEAGGICSCLTRSDGVWEAKRIEWNRIRMPPIAFTANRTMQEELLESINVCR